MRDHTSCLSVVYNKEQPEPTNKVRFVHICFTYLPSSNNAAVSAPMLYLLSNTGLNYLFLHSAEYSSFYYSKHFPLQCIRHDILAQSNTISTSLRSIQPCHASVNKRRQFVNKYQRQYIAIQLSELELRGENELLQESILQQRIRTRVLSIGSALYIKHNATALCQ